MNLSRSSKALILDVFSHRFKSPSAGHTWNPIGQEVAFKEVRKDGKGEILEERNGFMDLFRSPLFLELGIKNGAAKMI